MLIQTYCLFWRVEDVHWGKPKNPGRLLGYRHGAKSKVVDFRHQTGIYALYADYDLVYIGQTGAKSGQKLFHRLRQHRRHMGGRWNRFSWFGTKWVKQNLGLSGGTQASSAKLADTLNHLEAILIDVAEPKLNRQGGKWGKAVEYKQFRDKEKLGLADSEKIQKIYKKIAAS
jgi:hypothetical protein